MILGITGYKRHGKDSVAKFLSELYGFAIFSFATPIKEMAKAAFLWTDDYIENHKEEVDPRWGVSPRQVLQHIGTEWAQDEMLKSYPRFGEVTYKRLWVENCFERMRKHSEDFGQMLFAISDVRFPHEVEMIRASGGKIVKVERPSLMDVNDLHPSEQNINKINGDYFISNYGTLDELKIQVRYLFEGEF